MTVHPIPAATAALYQQALTLARDDRLVTFGPAGEFSESELIAVGLGAQALEPVSGQVAGAGLAVDRYGFSVDCLAQCWSGGSTDADLTDRMMRAFALVDMVRAVLPAVVAGVDGVWSADVAREAFTPFIADEGGIAAVGFGIAFSASRLF